MTPFNSIYLFLIFLLPSSQNLLYLLGIVIYSLVLLTSSSTFAILCSSLKNSLLICGHCLQICLSKSIFYFYRRSWSPLINVLEDLPMSDFVHLVPLIWRIFFFLFVMWHFHIRGTKTSSLLGGLASSYLAADAVCSRQL